MIDYLSEESLCADFNIVLRWVGKAAWKAGHQSKTWKIDLENRQQ